MIKALVIDDEPSATNTMKLMLQRYSPEISLLQTTTDIPNALSLISTFKPNLLFLDIQMPGTNGFDLLKQIPLIDFDVIFTTAHDKYAIQAIRFSALDYLLKPIDPDELQAAIQKFILKHQLNYNNKHLYNNFLHNIQSTKKEFKLAISTTEGTYFLSPYDIIRLEGEGNYTNFFFINRRPLLTSKTLKEYEEILCEHGFIRIHKSHMVNCSHVVSYKNEGELIMKDNSVVEISRRRKEEVLNALKQL